MKGNLNDFVAKFPEKKSYFILTNEKVRFVFPEPGPLEGVKSLSKHILKMTGVTFQYPTRDKPTVMDICLEVSRVSRVAVIGPNGAGKSTAIKLLIGELTPSEGVITKHPNMRLAYVAQHAFFHLEKHLNETPAQYIMWRFAGNEDKESLDLLNKKKEVDKEVTKYFIREGTTLCQCYSPAEEKLAVEPEAIINRHEDKKAKTKEYEVKWRGKSTDCNLWVKRDVLLSMGAEKMVQKFDEKMAAEAGLQFKPLTTSAIEKHLADFGIDPEDASHTLIKSLSGGQKIKVVMAACFWQNPHIIVLDEPTNYLDRDSLGALVQAIHDYKGGVIIISHNREFAGAVCQEKWIMDKGRLRREGESVATREEEEVKEELGDKVVIDALGNEIKVNKQTTLSDKEKKKEIKRIQKLITDGKKKKTISEDEILDLELKLEELKTAP
ncbi:elongation factor ef-3 [Nannochloropsis gaditana]|uniref:Elongation factor ef-3 n=1 Tax=Nannochloropsis gaditana TaxID=72520 RepID=W7TJN4_9STRA|nr:elongation factor ef-3 [Nannochloropsis gaditana]